MKVLKCCVLSLLTVIAIMSFNINPAVAAEKTDELKVVKKNKEITDPAKLLERAKKHILDDTYHLRYVFWLFLIILRDR